MGEAQVEVVCEGGPREMGFAQGAGLRQKIAGARDVLRRLEAFRLQQPWWLPYGLFRRLAERKAGRLLAGPLSRHYPDLAERLAGISEASGTPLNALYLLNALEAFLSSVRESTVVPPPSACSAVAVRGGRSATGEPIIARNFDYLPLVQPFFAMRDSRPKGRLRSVDFIVAPLCGALDGVNERGLCITYNYAFTLDAGDPAPTISMAIADALASCGTVAEATARIASRPRWGSGILMLADEAGDLASLELSNTRSHVRRPGEGEDLIFHTNAFWCDAMREVQIARDAVFADAAPPALRGRRVLQSPELRDQRLRSLLSGSAPLGPVELARLMADHGPNGEPSDDTVCMHGSYWGTAACLQLFPRSRRIRVAYEMPCRARYSEIAL